MIDLSDSIRKNGRVLYAVRCPKCDRKRYVRKDNYERNPSAPCRRCSCVAKGKKGAAATISKYGAEYFINKVRDRQLANPSSLEQEIMKVLDRLGIYYTRQVIRIIEDRIYILDFMVSNGYEDCFIEGNGKYWHEKPRAIVRDQRLLDTSPNPVLFLDEGRENEFEDFIKSFIGRR